MRHVQCLWRVVGLPVVLVAATTLGCGKDKTEGRPPVAPQLTSPRIAFTRGFAGIHLYDPATGNITDISHGFADEDPAISPDGRRIAFVSTSGGQRRLMTMAVDGTDRVPVLTNAQLSPAHPRWSPDSKRIVFTGTNIPSGTYDVYTIIAADDSLRPITSGGSSRALAWSPDGARILFVYHSVPANVDSLREISLASSTTGFIFGPTGGVVGADYSPDGSKIMATYPDNVLVMNSDGSGADAQGLPDVSEIGSPSWSPDGSLIALSAHPVGGGTYDLFLTSPTPADTVQLLLGGAENDSEPDWGPRP